MRKSAHGIKSRLPDDGSLRFQILVHRETEPSSPVASTAAHLGERRVAELTSGSAAWQSGIQQKELIWTH
jgi:hypothetical protein